ncbi:MAG: TIGR01212 family radical SAM protein [Desulfobacteraceae bacterium]|nr:TIGR01212 family radical SAM protein [Desulfobacteraceae bacterium]
MKKRFFDLNSYYRDKFGHRVHKITVDAGLNCPNRDGTISTGGCIYCNEKGSGTGAHLKGLSIAAQILNSKKAVAKRFKAKKFIAYFQSFTNTYAPFDTLKSIYDEALGVADVIGLAIGTRPDCVSDDILSLLGHYARHHLIWLEYGLQSAHDSTLALINRGHDVAAFVRAVDSAKQQRLNVCAHIILGLPGETRQHMMETADFISNIGIHGIKLHLLYVVRGTPLATMYAKGRYRCLEQAEYVDLVCEFLERLPARMVVHRLTGDPHPRELVAPSWALDKAGTLSMIKECLETEDRWQGKKVADSSNVSFGS